MSYSYFPAVDFVGRNQLTNSQIKSFDCGQLDLNKWFKQYSKVSHEKGLSVICMIERGKIDSTILGYTSFCSSSVEKEILPLQIQKGLGGYPVPVVLIARFAISKDFQRKGLGRRMIMHIYRNVWEAVNKGLGSRGIMVEAKDQGAINFYEKYDLQLLDGQDNFPKKMFIGIETINSIFV